MVSISSKRTMRWAMAAALVLIAMPLFAQAPATPPGAAGAAPAAPPGSQPPPKLTFDREVFAYPSEGRRDPFKPLFGGPGSGGPLFADIALRGIIYSPDPRRSVALVQVGGKRTFRLRRGDILGNARVTDIEPLRVRFAVENFGTIRNEVLDLRGSTQIQDEPIREIPAKPDNTVGEKPGNVPGTNHPRLPRDSIRVR